jgi:hypothetical protein
VEDALTDTLGVTPMLGVDDMVPLIVGVMDTEGEGDTERLAVTVADGVLLAVTEGVWENVGLGEPLTLDVRLSVTEGVLLADGVADCVAE